MSACISPWIVIAKGVNEMFDIHINSIKQAFPGVEVIDYVITVKMKKWYEKLNLLHPYEQLLIFLLSDHRVAAIRILGTGKVCEPELLQSVNIEFETSFMNKRIILSNSSKCNGLYSVVKKYEYGEYLDEQEFLRVLTMEIKND